ncbi:hypothetical protein BC938DRAFT_476472 [Jimgerdemannia flammicorona]|uniref:Uncharacterized protein n=1 Tax=Jimgerdemannia flammicorona TaxID=994334 RepID=A0A433QQG2_9FUNG|nr:hypothetical protein BC938DRAFT_476472 [Jimgerdemannia flammicorona]
MPKQFYHPHHNHSSSTVSSVNTTTSLFQSSIASSLYTTSPIEEFPKGYFYIKSKKNGMVLDVEGDSIKVYV